MTSPDESDGVEIHARQGTRRKSMLQTSQDFVHSFSRSQQLQFGRYTLGNTSSFAFSSIQPHDADYGATGRQGEGTEDDWESHTADGSQGEEHEEDEERSRRLHRRDESGFFFEPDYSIDEEGHHQPGSTPASARRYLDTPASSKYRDRRASSLRPGGGPGTESTPLLRRDSFTPSTRGKRVGRKNSMTSEAEKQVVTRGDSTDGQTLFNVVAVLVGIGILSLPLAFAYMGWIGGSVVLIGAGLITSYTAKLIARLIAADPHIRGFTDLALKAFGPWAGVAITLLFCLELFTYGLALIVLFGDSMNAIFPSISPATFKIINFILVIPTTLMPLRLLSLPSMISTMSSFMLIFIVVIDGVTKREAPGSLFHPAPTSIGPQWARANWLGGIGFVLAGLGGHAVIPSLARDMKHPEHFDWVVNRAFAIATGLGFICGSAGYLMIGNDVSEEITKNLMDPYYGYSKALNVFALCLIVVNPITKFGLCSRPFNHTLEAILGIERTPWRSPEKANETFGVHAVDHNAIADMSHISRVARGSFSSFSVTPHHRPSDAFAITPARTPASQSHIAVTPAHLATVEEAIGEDDEEIATAKRAWKRVERRKLAARVITRTAVTAASTVGAILAPGFGKVMAFMGCFASFMIAIILPTCFYLALAPAYGIVDRDSTFWKRQRAALWTLVTVSACLVVAGTTWSVRPGEE